MKLSISCSLLILSSVFLVAQQSYARKDLGGYWKSEMNDEPMPEAIRDLFSHQDHEEDDHVVRSLPAGSKEHDHFVRDFDTRPNVIIYHGAHDQPAEKKPFFIDSKPNHG